MPSWLSSEVSTHALLHTVFFSDDLQPEKPSVVRRGVSFANSSPEASPRQIEVATVVVVAAAAAVAVAVAAATAAVVDDTFDASTVEIWS